MFFVNLDCIDRLIKLNELNLDDLSEKIKLVNFYLRSFDECYSGKSLQSFVEIIIKQTNNLNKISQVISSYSDVFNDVLLSYKELDYKVIKNVESHINQ